MKGSYIVKVHNHRVTYTVELERNITIICGDSATGKTTLINSIAYYEELGESSGVRIESEKNCCVLKGKNWFEDLERISDSLVFIDEGSAFIQTVEFARAIQYTDNYYVFVTRENLHQLPYSVDSILELKKTTSRFKHTYNRTYPRYACIHDLKNKLELTPMFLTEDSNSGNDLFSFLADKNGLQCVSAEGKDNVLNRLKGLAGRKTIVVADGAAFGANMADVYRYAKMHEDDVALYLPESFEWIVLSSGIIRDEEIRNILNRPGQYIECSKYISWERFFTALLEEKTKGTNMQYTKKKLSKSYLTDKNLEKMVAVIEGRSNVI